MSVLRAIKHNWDLFRWLGLGFCSFGGQQGQELTFGTRDLIQTLLINIIYLATSWWYLFVLFAAMDSTAEQFHGASTMLAVSQVSYVTEQVANTLLLLFSVVKQSKFVQVCNKLHEIDQLLGEETQLNRPHQDQQPNNGRELRSLYAVTLGSLFYFGVTFLVYMVYVATWEGVFQTLSLIRPVVNDFLNLQFISLALLINNRINRMQRHLDASRGRRGGGGNPVISSSSSRTRDCDNSLIYALLFRLAECIEVTNREFSSMFLIQSVRIAITVDNNCYQLLILFDNNLIQEYLVVMFFVLSLISFSVAVYVAVGIVGQRTRTAYEKLLADGLHGGSGGGGGQMILPGNDETSTTTGDGGAAAQDDDDYGCYPSWPGFGGGGSSTTTSASLPSGSGRMRMGGCGLVQIDRESKICLYFLQQRNQRQGRGFGFTAFGVLDIDLGGVFLVSTDDADAPLKYYICVFVCVCGMNVQKVFVPGSSGDGDGGGSSLSTAIQCRMQI